MKVKVSNEGVVNVTCTYGGRIESLKKGDSFAIEQPQSVQFSEEVAKAPSSGSAYPYYSKETIPQPPEWDTEYQLYKDAPASFYAADKGAPTTPAFQVKLKNEGTSLVNCKSDGIDVLLKQGDSIALDKALTVQLSEPSTEEEKAIAALRKGMEEISSAPLAQANVAGRSELEPLKK